MAVPRWRRRLAGILFSVVLSKAKNLSSVLKSNREILRFAQNDKIDFSGGSYLTNSPSRSWSRPTNIFDVRNRPNKLEISRF